MPGAIKGLGRRLFRASGSEIAISSGYGARRPAPGRGVDGHSATPLGAGFVPCNGIPLVADKGTAHQKVAISGMKASIDGRNGSGSANADRSYEATHGGSKLARIM